MKDNFAGYVDFIGSAGNGTTRQLTRLDANNDGIISDAELQAGAESFIDNVGHGTRSGNRWLQRSRNWCGDWC